MQQKKKNDGIAPLGLDTAHHGMTDAVIDDTSILLGNAQVENFILYDVAESEMLLQTTYHEVDNPPKSICIFIKAKYYFK